MRITGDDGLRWYRSSDCARREFCSARGPSLFRRENDTGPISVAAGAIDGETRLHLEKHIYQADKGDLDEGAYREWLDEGFTSGELWQKNLLGGYP